MKIFIDLVWFFKQEKWKYLTGAVLLIIVALLNLIPPYIVGRVVDGIQGGSLNASFLLSRLAIILAVAVVVYVLRYFWRIMIFGSAFKLGMILRNRLYRHFTRLSPSFYHKRRIGDLMAHSTNDIEAVEGAAGDGVLTLVDSISTGGIVVLTMAFIDWRLTLLTLIPMPFMAWTTGKYGMMLHRRFDKAQAAFSDLNDKVQENITGIRVVKSFGQEEAEIASFRDLSSDVVRKNVAVAQIDSLFGPTITFIVGLSFMIAVGVGAFFVLSRDLTIGELTSFTIYLGHLIWPMLAFGFLFNIMERGSASYDRISRLLEVKTEVFDREGAQAIIPSGDLEVAIRRFAYPEKKESALEEIFFTLKQGQTLGIVGKTGSGKTTLLKLFLREFDLSQGQIRIGGRFIDQVSLEALRSAIGYVPQDHFLFSATVGENIAFGNPEAAQPEIERAAKIAAIHEDILRFEKGYETVVGERGVTLSGGQKQRISIARAVLLDPEILILDDSLSAVDAKTEEEILERLTANRTGKTTLISAHRLSAIAHADLILVLEEGRIIQQGAHADLMAEEGWYREMYQRQQLESEVTEGGRG